MTGLSLDIRQALRNLRKTPGILVVVLVTIALGVGINTAMFSVVHSVVLSPLPYPDSDRLVSPWPEKRWSYPMLSDVEERVTSFEALSGYTTASYTLLGDGGAEAVVVGRVSPTHFDVLGIRAGVGAGFVPGDGVNARGPVVVLGHGFWQRHFGGDPSVIGRGIRLAGNGLEDRTVVGILPADVEPLPSSPDAWVPIIREEGQPGSYGSYGLSVIGRLRPGVSVEEASMELRGFVDELTPMHATQFRPIRYSPVDVVPLLETMTRHVRTQLLVLLGAVGFILLIACTNVANLLLARARVRRRETAVQLALGCGPRRIVRQVLTESVMLGVAGGGIGVGAAVFGLPLITSFVSGQLPRTSAIAMDAPVLVFALSISIVAGLLFGAIPALRAARSVPADVMRSSAGRGQSQSRGSGRVNDVLVVAQMALSLVLLAGAGLMLKSVWQLTRVNPGFEAEHVLTMQITLPPQRYDSLDVRDILRREIEAQVGAVQGVEAVSSIGYLPLSGAAAGWPYRVEGQDGAGESAMVVDVNFVSPGYFDLMGIPLRSGRLYGPQDTPDAETALLANETFARQHWPEGDAIGNGLLWESGERIGRIVGIVGDVRQRTLAEPALPEIYVSAAQVGWPASSALLLRGSEGAPSIEEVTRALHAVEAELAPRNVRTMNEVLAQATESTRFYARLLLAFAALALLLGLVGVYGVVSYAVSRRTGELGVRLALGATGKDLMSSVMSRSMAPVMLGIVLGLGGALVLTRLLSSLVFEVEVTDPWVLGGVSLLLTLAGATAALLPAARATRISPVRALQGE